MRSAIEKLADREHPRGRREMVCHRCGTRCAVDGAAAAALEATACIGCLRPLGAARRRDGRPPRALAAVADWWDKAAAPGPGYGVVVCPRCATACVVEAGAAARTGCVGCLQPLGAAPLVRTDLARRDPDDERADSPSPSRALAERACVPFPGEPS